MHNIDTIRIIKRNGRQVNYDRGRIDKAITGAFLDLFKGELTAEHHAAIQVIAQGVENILQGRRSRKIPVETVQDIVESQIMASGYAEVARQFVLYRHEKQKARNLRTSPNSEAIADYLFTSKYSRWLPEAKRRETWDEMVDRAVNMHISRFPSLAGDIHKAFDYVRRKRVLHAGRHMQFAGEAILKNNARGFNCAATSIDRAEVFGQLMFALLSGCGAGIDVTFECIEKLPVLAPMIDESLVEHFTIPDSIEGWQDAVDKLIDSYIKGYLVEFNYSLIRPRGSLLKTSGGRAPGHVPLRKALDSCRLLLNGCLGRGLKPIEAFDLCCYIADAVVSGGIRRAALLAMFSPDDGEMMSSKSGTWQVDNGQRANANISVKLVRKEMHKPQFLRIMSRIREFGEPGFVIVDDPLAGVNPCGEAGLRMYTKDGKPGFSFCNLTTINGAILRSERELRSAVWAAAFIGTLQASYVDFPRLGTATEEIVREDSLLGISITGMMDNPDLMLNEEILGNGSRYALEVNAEVAAKIGINPAKRVTCIKPEGTSSLVLGGVSPGIHPHFSQRFFRRVTANTVEAPYRHFKHYNIHACEPSVYNPNVDDKITFCVEAPAKSLLWDSLTAIAFLKEVIKIQKHWVDAGARVTSGEPRHAVSNTVLVHSNEWPEVGDFVWENRDYLMGVTFMQRIPGFFPQMPIEPVVTEEQEIKWRYLIENYRAVDYTDMVEEEDGTTHSESLECSGKGCALK